MTFAEGKGREGIGVILDVEAERIRRRCQTVFELVASLIATLEGLGTGIRDHGQRGVGIVEPIGERAQQLSVLAQFHGRGACLAVVGQFDETAVVAGDGLHQGGVAEAAVMAAGILIDIELHIDTLVGLRLQLELSRAVFARAVHLAGSPDGIEIAALARIAGQGTPVVATGLLDLPVVAIGSESDIAFLLIGIYHLFVHLRETVDRGAFGLAETGSHDEQCHGS